MNKDTMKTKIKTRIDVETCCLTCKMFFTINDFQSYFNMDDINSGFHLSGIECPGCGMKTLDFDFVVVEEKYPLKPVIEHRIKERNKLNFTNNALDGKI